MNLKYQIKTFTEIDQYLIEEWKTLWNQASNATVFNSYPWFKATSKASGLNNLIVYVCYQNDELVAILPLVEERRFGIKVLTTHLGSYVSDEAIILKKHNPELLKQLILEISKNHNLYLTRISSSNTEGLNKIFPEVFLSIIGVNPVTSLKGDLFVSFSKSTKKDIKSVTKKAGDKLDFKIFKDEDISEKLLEVMIKIDIHSGKQKHSRDIFSKEEEKMFFLNLMKYCREYIEICLLYYDNKPIAYSFNLKGGKVYFGYQTSYLFKQRKLSPGKLLIIDLLKELVNSEYELLDYGEGFSTYKQKFTKKYLIKYDLHYSRNKLIMLWWKSINFARRYKQVLFPEKNSRDHEFLFKKFKGEQ